MSGGSWNYIYSKFQNTADELSCSSCIYRRVLGEKIQLIAEALKAIEWVDSGDWVPGDEIEPIRAALGGTADQVAIECLLKDGAKLVEKLKELGVSH